MMSFKTNQKQINKLDARVTKIADKISGGFFGGGLEDKVFYLERELESKQKSYDYLNGRIKVLEQIVRESGLITDFEDDEVKIREDKMIDMFGTTRVKQTPYQINKVKVL